MEMERFDGSDPGAAETKPARNRALADPDTATDMNEQCRLSFSGITAPRIRQCEVPGTVPMRLRQEESV
jgi:hypothetical protein